MTYTEAWELAERKLDEVNQIIVKTKNSDKIKVETTLSYMDDDLNEYSEYVEEKNISLVGSISVRDINTNGDDSPEYNAAFLVDIKGGETEHENALSDELSEFDNEIGRFITKLSSAENIEELIKEENELREKEGEEIIAKFEKQLDNLKKYAIIGIAGVALLAIIIALINLF